VVDAIFLLGRLLDSSVAETAAGGRTMVRRRASREGASRRLDERSRTAVHRFDLIHVRGAGIGTSPIQELVPPNEDDDESAEKQILKP